ncbi:glycosyltransferase [Roseiflexus sp.]|uniref:glycosyltransferase n=1 Tax=Roseiflexus sp. TaxID=2562120 RepID=UPI00398A8F41
MKRLRRALRRLLPHPDGYGKDWSSGGKPRVLFVSSMDGAPLRYRVLHQAEQIALVGGSWMLMRDTDSSLVQQVYRCDILYLYRTGHTLQVDEAITVARARAVPIVYDTDDLTWDERLVEYCELERYYSPHEVARFRSMFRDTEHLMRTVDCFVASTEYLGSALRAHFGVPVYVNTNALPQKVVAQTEPIYRQRALAPSASRVVIGYFSGWPKAHESDLLVALPALRRVLNEVPEACLRIVGHFDRAVLPDDLRARVEAAPFVPYEQLFDEIARVDINLAPLVPNPHRRAKSAVKFLEAALVGVPTVASDLEPYRVIDHGHTGWLAADEEGWYAGMMALATDPARRRAIGAAARAHVLTHETTVVRAPAFGTWLRHLVAERL